MKIYSLSLKVDGNAQNAKTTTSKAETSATDARKTKLVKIEKVSQSTCHRLR